MKINNKIKDYYLNYSKNILWKKKPKKSVIFDYKGNRHQWFQDGILSPYENLIDNNIKKNLNNKTAIITVSKNKLIQEFSYSEIDARVNRLINHFFNGYKKKKLKVMIQASASIESAILMLACSKLGIHFSVIFEDLEKIGLLNRINLFKPNIIFTRQDKKMFNNNFKKNLNIKIFYQDDFNKAMNLRTYKKHKNLYVKSHSSFFTLFTSGSTGMPKGVTHSTGGYLLYTRLSCEKKFGMKNNSIVLTGSDAGWINGHTYSLFGPLLFGSTTILLETPMSLLEEKLLNKILKIGVTILYLPVTLLRLIKSISKIKKFRKNITSLGSMGEPLAPAVAKWFSDNFSPKKNKSIVNTYFQTETGGIILSPKFNQNINNAPHGSVGSPISSLLKINRLDKNLKKEIKIITPWPGMMKDIINGKKEWNKYWDSKNNFRLFDLATIKNRSIYVHGRNDDVINIRGHRIGSGEIESTVLRIKEIIETCAINILDELEGSKIYLFVVSKKNVDTQIEKILLSTFGSFAIPKKIIKVSELPKTKSGKFLRRLLRSLIENPNLSNLGDTSTILNYRSINIIKKELTKL
jgi:acetyl-CoA synthetase